MQSRPADQNQIVMYWVPDEYWFVRLPTIEERGGGKTCLPHSPGRLNPSIRVDRGSSWEAGGSPREASFVYLFVWLLACRSFNTNSTKVVVDLSEKSTKSEFTFSAAALSQCVGAYVYIISHVHDSRTH